MESLSDLDDCINTLERLQLTLDFETSTIKRKTSNISPIDFETYNSSNVSENRLDLIQSNPQRSSKDIYDIHLPDLTKLSKAVKSEQAEKNDPVISPKISDFKSQSVNRLETTQIMSNDNEMDSVIESEAADFPAPPPPFSAYSDNYMKSYTSYHSPYGQSSTNSSPSMSRNTLFHTSNRKQSTNSAKLPPRIPMDLQFDSVNNNNNNNNNSENSSQSNLSSSAEKESKDITFPKTESALENPDLSKQAVVRFFNSDKTTKALMVNEKMTVGDVITILMEKNFWIPSLKSAIVEKVPCLKMERFLEEHECLLDCVRSWPPTCTNMIFFEQRDDIYGMFENAKNSLGDNYPFGSMDVDVIKNLCYNLVAEQHEYQDYIYIKKPTENTWKRKFCLLNCSGITTIQKRKSKKKSNVMAFSDKYFLYTTTGGWTKEWEAPTPFGFAFKPYSVFDPKSDQLLMFCASDEISMKRWCNNLRLCKYKNQIINNYQNMQTRSIYCSNLYTTVHRINRIVSISPPIYSKTLNHKYNSRCSLPTIKDGEPKNESNTFKF